MTNKLSNGAVAGLPPIERFYLLVEKTEGCWNWIGGKKAAGYGQFLVNGKKVIAHRWSYRNFVGHIPDGYEIDHKCRNRSCVNPDHLETVTLEENRRRRVEAKTHCVHGHEYLPENTRTKTDKDGYVCRYCRTCDRKRAAEQREKKKNELEAFRQPQAGFCRH